MSSAARPAEHEPRFYQKAPRRAGSAAARVRRVGRYPTRTAMTVTVSAAAMNTARNDRDCRA
jgi:hypothetical protein